MNAPAACWGQSRRPRARSWQPGLCDRGPEGCPPSPHTPARACNRVTACGLGKSNGRLPLPPRRHAFRVCPSTTRGHLRLLSCVESLCLPTAAARQSAERVRASRFLSRCGRIVQHSAYRGSNDLLEAHPLTFAWTAFPVAPCRNGCPVVPSVSGSGSGHVGIAAAGAARGPAAQPEASSQPKRIAAAPRPSCRHSLGFTGCPAIASVPGQAVRLAFFPQLREAVWPALCRPPCPADRRKNADTAADECTGDSRSHTGTAMQ